MYVIDNQTGRTTPRDRGVRQHSGQGKRSCNVTFLFDPLKGASREEGQYNWEGGTEQRWKCKNNRKLFKYDRRRAERS